MVSTPDGFTYNSLMLSSQSVTVKNLVQENHSVCFQNHWKSNLRLLPAGFVMINKIARQSDMEVCCGPVFQIVVEIQKSINRSKKTLLLDYTTRPGCAVPNRNLLSIFIY